MIAPGLNAIEGEEEAGAAQSDAGDDAGSDRAPGRRTRLTAALRRQLAVPYALPTAMLGAAFLLDCLWTVHPVTSVREVTVGRIGLLLTGIFLAAATVRHRAKPWRLPLTAALLSAGLVLGVVVIGASAAVHGTLRSHGSFAGFTEFTVVTLLVLALAGSGPRFGLILLLSSAVGTVIADALALTGIQSAQFGGTSRLQGAFGNPNYLAFATSLSLAVLLASLRFASTRMRLAILVVIPVPVATLVLTYSRAGLIGAATAAIMAAALWGSSRRARFLITTGAIVVAAGSAVGLYSIYQHVRLRADFASEIAGGLPDRSGWDPSAQGLIDGGSRLRNAGGGVLVVRPVVARGGVSHPIGPVLSDGLYRLSLDVRTNQPNVVVGLGMEDNYAGNGPVKRFFTVSRRWRRLTETWVPTSRSTHPRFYLWTPRPTAVLYLHRVVVLSDEPVAGSYHHRIRMHPIGTKLHGAPTPGQAFSGAERDFVQSRIQAVKLSVRLFLNHPLFGVGWERYRAYAARDLSARFNAGSVHDDYLRPLAELGIPGALFLLACIAAVIWRLLRGGLSVTGRLTLTPLAAAAVGLFFITALETPAVSLSLAAALGVLCASRPRRAAQVEV